MAPTQHAQVHPDTLRRPLTGVRKRTASFKVRNGSALVKPNKFSLKALKHKGVKIAAKYLKKAIQKVSRAEDHSKGSIGRQLKKTLSKMEQLGTLVDVARDAPTKNPPK